MWIEVLVVLVLTLLNGLLAMSELAIVSARPARLKVLAERGDRGAATALQLGEDPGRFLSSVQIGITLVGILSGAFSGATLGARLAGALPGWGVPPSLAQPLGMGGVVVAITYLSLIVGELVPKQIALREPEAVASRVAPTMTLLSRLAAPLVWLLDTSGRLVLKLLGQSGKTSDGVTDEEIKSVLAEAHSAGVIETGESRMIAGVMRLADRTARGLMTPRMDVEMVDIDDSFDEIREQLQNTSRSRLPVRGEDSDEVIGVLQVRDFFNQLSSKGSVNLREIVRDVPVVSDFSDALDVVEAIRGTPTHMVLVYDEYGHFEGVITAGDVIEAIIGAMQDEDHVEEKAIVRRADGSYLVSGWMPIDEFSEFLRFPIDDDAEYNTVAGLALEELKHLPDVGETFVKHGWVFEIVDLDGRRIDKLLLTAEEQPTE